MMYSMSKGDETDFSLEIPEVLCFVMLLLFLVSRLNAPFLI